MPNQPSRKTRPPIQSRSWAVVSAHPLSTVAAVRTFHAGGNAVDAAVAVAGAVSVVEPFESNLLGGESYILYWKEREKRLFVIEATGQTPLNATLDQYRSIGGIPFYGSSAVIIPGSFYGWCLLLADHGSMRLGEVLAPGIELAEEGFAVSPRLHRLMTEFNDVLARFPTSARVFLKNGKPYKVGELLVQKNFADTLRCLATRDKEKTDRIAGIKAALNWVYCGDLARAWCEFLRADGGLITEEDLSTYEARYVEPIRSSYRNLDLYMPPPPSQGIVLLEALNILEGYDFKQLGLGSAASIHVMVEALKLAYGDREKYVADPEFIAIPAETLLSKTYAQSQRRRVDLDQALVWPFNDQKNAHSDTTIIITADSEGNILIATTSIGRVGYIAGDTGVVLNNRMRMFHEEPNHPNCVAPRKRVRITLNPLMVFKNGRPYLALGSPGGDVQSQAQLQGLLGIVEYGLDPQGATETARWVSTAFPDTSLPHFVEGALKLEPNFPESVRKELEAKGHRVTSGLGQGMLMVLQASPSGGWIAGADPRGEAYAAGWCQA